MAVSHWHKLYTVDINASPAVLFGLVADLPNYGRWLPGSASYGSTTDVEPYPVRLGSRYHDGKPGEPGKEWWGEVTGFQPPGSLDFHHTIRARQVGATIDTDIHYSFESAATLTRVTRWLVLTIAMPLVLRPLRPLIISAFDKENVRTMAALAEYAEAHVGELTDE
jgi:hypothetical protein